MVPQSSKGKETLTRRGKFRGSIINDVTKRGGGGWSFCDQGHRSVT